MSGFLDNILNIFEQHHHPFILVGMYGMLWNGVDVARYRRDSIEVLIDSSRTMISVAESLLQTGDWILSTLSNSSSDQELKLESAAVGFGPAQYTSPTLHIAYYLDSFVTDLYLDWPPTRKWFLDTKVADSNKARMQVALEQPRSTYDDLMDSVLDTFVRDKLPWELTVPREGKESLCDERCEYCQSKGS